MAEFFLSLNFVIGLVVDVIILFLSAGLLGVRGNSFGKAVILIVVASFLGYILGPLLLILLFVSLGGFLVALMLSLFIRLILIKAIYSIGLGKAFSVWVLSAIVSVIVYFLLPV